MPLCQHCSVITLPALLPSPLIHDPELNCDISYRHWNSYTLLRRSAGKCELCLLILHTLDAGDEYGGIKDRREDFEKFFGKGDDDRSQVYLRAGDVYHLGTDVPKRIALISVECGSVFTGVLRLYAHDDDPAAVMGDITGRDLSLNPLSDRNIALIRNWINDCVTSHALCVLNADSRPLTNSADPPVLLPSRLVDIAPLDGASLIRIEQTSGQYGSYAALSHCWGKSQILTTTKGTFNQRMNGIDLAALPKTFRHAITIARRLGTRYIWIDSLCIIQDDVDDWNKQAPLMGYIYRNAHYTISATGATGGEVGCLFQREGEAIPPVTIRYKSPRYQNRECEMTFGLAHGSFGATIERAPLNLRAWALQERILSRRIIHFGAEQIYFECQRHCLAEDGSQHVVTGQIKQSFDLRDYLGPERDDLKQHEWQRIYPLFWRWCLMVQDYSCRGLTKFTDKLPALAGLANEVRKRTGDEYYSGVWKENMHISLLWRAKHIGSLQYPPSFRAPSWSWAAVDGQLSFLPLGNLFALDAQKASSKPWKVTLSQKPGYLGDHWEIFLSAARRRITYTSEATEPNHTRLSSRKIRNYDGKQIGEGIFDLEPARLPVDVDCCLISQYKSEHSYRRGYGILLIEEVTGEQNTFRRAGMGNVTSLQFFNGCLEENIRLI